MSEPRHEFCDHCPGCRPGLIELSTGKVMAADSPIMIAVHKMWNTQTSYAERKAFIEATYHNSREPKTLELAKGVVQKMQLEMDKMGSAS